MNIRVKDDPTTLEVLLYADALKFAANEFASLVEEGVVVNLRDGRDENFDYECDPEKLKHLAWRMSELDGIVERLVRARARLTRPASRPAYLRWLTEQAPTMTKVEVGE